MEGLFNNSKNRNEVRDENILRPILFHPFMLKTMKKETESDLQFSILS